MSTDFTKLDFNRIKPIIGNINGVDFADPYTSKLKLNAFEIGIIYRVKVYRKTGSGSFFANLYQNSDVSDTKDRAFRGEAELIEGQWVMDLAIPGPGAFYKNSEGKNELYLVVQPSAGASNNFYYEVYIDRAGGNWKCLLEN